MGISNEQSIEPTVTTVVWLLVRVVNIRGKEIMVLEKGEVSANFWQVSKSQRLKLESRYLELVQIKQVLECHIFSKFEPQAKQKLRLNQLVPIYQEIISSIRDRVL